MSVCCITVSTIVATVVIRNIAASPTFINTMATQHVFVLDGSSYEL